MEAARARGAGVPSIGRIAALEAAVARDGDAPWPGAVRRAAELARLYDAEARAFLARAAAPGGLGTGHGFRPDCAARCERLRLVHRARGPDGPVFAIAARGRAMLAAAPAPAPPTWRACLARLPGHLDRHVRFLGIDLLLALALAGFAIAWWIAATIDRFSADPVLDASGEPR